MIRRAPRAVIVACSLMAGGCVALGMNDDGEPPPVPASRPKQDAGSAPDAGVLSVDVGTGNTAYTELSDGDPVDIIEGPQGGYHIWTSVRVHDPDLDYAVLDVSARFLDTGQPVGSGALVASLLTDGHGVRERWGLTNFVSNPGVTHGRQVILRVLVRAADGREGLGERTVAVR